MVANAHLDPVWQWQWEDGFAEAVSTFRIACEFCETHPGFIFNHNVHHRAQLGVYLRMLDVAVPGHYGPTADDRA